MRVVWVNGDDGKEIEVVSVRFKTEVGFKPAEGELILLDESFKNLGRSGSLRFEPLDSDTFKETLTISSLQITGYERRDSEEGGSLFKVQFADRRLFWRFATISLRFSSDDAPSFSELVGLLFSEIGETPSNLSSLPETPFPLLGVEWHSKEVVSLLSSLLALVGRSVSIDYSGVLRLVEVGAGGTTTVEEDYVDEVFERRFSLRPDVVEFVGAPLLLWRRSRLEPVGVDTDGCIKPLDELSYLQGIDVGVALANGFAELDETARQLAQSSVGRMFRIPPQGHLPLLPSDYNGTRPRISSSFFVEERKRGYRNTEGSVPFKILDTERGLVLTEVVCGTLSNEQLDLLPSIVDGEPVRVELSDVVLEYPTYKRDSDGSYCLWRRRYGNGSSKVRIDAPSVRVTEPDGLFYERVCKAVAERILSLPECLDVVSRRYVGARNIVPSSDVQSVEFEFKDGEAFTTTKSGSVFFDFKYLKDSFLSLFCETVSSVRCSEQMVELPKTSFYRRMVSANKLGVVPLLSDADEDTPSETRIAGYLRSYDEETGTPEVVDVVPFERFNFSVRTHKTSRLRGEEPQDKVWAVRLITDDKHRIEYALNRSTNVIRLCDENEGDLDDIWRVRAVPSPSDTAAGIAQAGSPTYLPVVSSNLSYRVMWLINTAIGAEGGWMTDVPPDGLGITVRDCPKQVAPPRHIGQVGNIVVLTDDDLICTTSDGDAFVLANLRHDAHFHLDRDHDGRIRFTTTPPGMRPTDGWTVIGEMVCDPSLANDNTELKLESGQWCPQIRINSSVTPIYPLGVTLLVEESPTVSLPLSGLTNAEFDGLSVAEAKKKNADLENRIVEVINAIFTADME